MGSKQRGKIPEPGYSILVRNQKFLESDIHKASDLTSSLFSAFVIDEDDKDVIESKEKNEGRKAGIKTLIDILLYSGPDAYPRFIKCLRENDYGIVADTLETTSIEARPDPFIWIEELPIEKQNKPLNEKDLVILAGYFLSGWESVMISLGINQAHISHDKMNNLHNVHMQIFNSLNRWRQKHASGATLKKLLDAMKSFPNVVLWEDVQKFASECS